ncbi:MAG: GNAT family N-acetyltransferase [Candidatus Melainabacteria bacterium]|nr:MAG: GNAT family N-acetyltransferase [Candidatus Melainabacteria bacterium]
MFKALALSVFPSWGETEHSPSAFSSVGLHPSFTAREATTQDLDSMLELFFAIFAEPSFNDKAKGFDLYDRMKMRYSKDPAKHEREFWGGDKNRRLAIVVHDKKTGKLVGSAWLISDLDSNASDDVGEINKIYLLPEVRGKGLGLWLMRTMIRQARVLKFRRLSLITGRELSKAVSLYSKLGFVPASQGRYSNSPNSIAMTYDIPVCCHGEACDN